VISQDPVKNNRPLEVAERLPHGRVQPCGELGERAERRIEPPRNSSVGGEFEDVVSHTALSDGQQIRHRWEWLGGRCHSPLEKACRSVPKQNLGALGHHDA